MKIAMELATGQWQKPEEDSQTVCQDLEVISESKFRVRVDSDVINVLSFWHFPSSLAPGQTDSHLLTFVLQAFERSHSSSNLAVDKIVNGPH